MEVVIPVDKTKQFGAFLSKARERSGYKSQRSLAIDAGISAATLSRIESGVQKPTPETLKSISRFLRDVTYEELLEQAGILDDAQASSQRSENPKSDNSSLQGLAFINSGEELDEEEIEYLRESLELFRRMKERKAKEREGNNK